MLMNSLKRLKIVLDLYKYGACGGGELPLWRPPTPMALSDPELCRRLCGLPRDDVHARDKSGGRTLLHYATGWGSAKAVELLIRQGAGADVNARDNSGRTPLIDAVIFWSGAICETEELVRHLPWWPALGFFSVKLWHGTTLKDDRREMVSESWSISGDFGGRIPSFPMVPGRRLS